MYRFFIQRPIVAIVIAILLVLVGSVSMVSLPISQFPEIVPPEIRIQATFVGADAKTVAESIATPIEEQMSGVDNMNYMYSISANNGTMRMGVNLDVKTDPNVDQVLAQLRENQAEAQLPQDGRNYGITLLKSPTTPMMLVGLYSPNGTHDAIFLANYAYINLVDQVTQLKGVSNVQVFGAGQYAMRFWVKPDQLAKLNITVNDLINAINAQNTVNPAGQVGGPPTPKGQEFTYAITAQSRLVTEQEFEDILANTPGVKYYTSLVGFSLLSQVIATYNAFFFVTLKPWSERSKREEQFGAIQAHLNTELSKLPEATAFAFPPPSVPGIGTAGGFTFILEDRSGSQDLAFLTTNLNGFLTAARKRPELTGLSTTHLPDVPQIRVKVNRHKVLKQGVPINDVYRTLQTFMGGYFVNYFNRFGRQWQVYIEAEDQYRTRAENIGLFYVRNNQGQSVSRQQLADARAHQARAVTAYQEATRVRSSVIAAANPATMKSSRNSNCSSPPKTRWPKPS